VAPATAATAYLVNRVEQAGTVVLHPLCVHLFWTTALHQKKGMSFKDIPLFQLPDEKIRCLNAVHLSAAAKFFLAGGNPGQPRLIRRCTADFLCPRGDIDDPASSGGLRNAAESEHPHTLNQ
jgi:hypothetical protein